MARPMRGPGPQPRHSITSSPVIRRRLRARAMCSDSRSAESEARSRSSSARDAAFASSAAAISASRSAITAARSWIPARRANRAAAAELASGLPQCCW